MSLGVGRQLLAAGLVLVSLCFVSAAWSEPGSTVIQRLPVAEVTKLEADAVAGNVDAQFLLMLYLLGKDDGRDSEARIGQLRELAASAGHPAAQSTMCMMQSLADGEQRSTTYCFSAAYNGDVTAQSWLGLGLTLGMFGLKQDQTSALSFYRQAAFQGQASALARVGDAYSQGEGVDKDDVLAVHYWERAASMDEASSLRQLGGAYVLGRGVGEDLDKALGYLNRASDLGDGTAQYYAGIAYRLKSNPLGAYVMFALAVKTLSPGELRDAAIKARSEEQRGLTKAELQRARPIISNWKKSEPRPRPFIGGIEFVKRLQAALNKRGYDAGESDGLAGSKTRAAYRQFADSLQLGELTFSSPDVYYVGYKLNLFGMGASRSAPAPSAEVEPAPGSGTSPVGNQAAVKSGGSGFIVNSEGYVVTNAHVVKGCTSVRVIYGTNEPAAASVVEVSEFSDLAVLRAPLVAPKPVSFRGGVAPKLGENIIVFGFPLTGVLSDQGNLTVGNLTALSGMRGDPSALQISAPVQPGNSGGPVLDSKGQLIGVVVSKLDALAVAGLTDDIPQNVNFAIRATVLENLLQSRSLSYERGPETAPDLPVTDLAERAKNAAVMIECVGT